MGKVKELKIKNQTYHYFNDIIDIKDFQSNLLTIDKKHYEDIDIYYIGYIAIKKFGDCENIHSVNPLYLLIYSATGYFKEKNGEKYLILDSTEKYEEFFLELKKKLKRLMKEKKCIMKNIMQKLELIQMMIYL